MLVLILGWVYISLISIAWGNILLNAISRLLKSPFDDIEIDLSIIFLAGISAVGCIAMYISLFLAIDWKVQSFFFTTSLCYFILPGSRKRACAQILHLARSVTLPGLIFLFLVIFPILLINSYSIIHPDTLAYHAQAIRWIENYSATPGIVHLRRELGFQSIWFILEAVFGFKISGTPMVFYPGGAVLCWFLVFMIQQFGWRFSRNQTADKQFSVKGFLILIILIYSFASWTQIRLTAASASPDFITSIFILAAVYCFLTAYTRRNEKAYFSISALFALTAICIKLSAIVIILLPLFALWVHAYKKCWRNFKIILGLLLIIILPLLIRNYVASGLPLFPSRLLNFFNPDWKFDQTDVLKFQHYINAYARFPVSNSESERVFSMPVGDWIAPWWRHLGNADKAILVLLMALILFNLIFIRKLLAKASVSLLVTISILIIALFIWFMNAPDPRFASGFLLSLLYCLTIPWWQAFESYIGNYGTKIGVALTYIFLVGILSYSIYRFRDFFEPGQIVFPMGMAKSEYKSILCGNLEINMATGKGDCGSTTPPCVTDSCNVFEPRGARVQDGFRMRK